MAGARGSQESMAGLLEWPRQLRAGRQCMEPIQRGIMPAGSHQFVVRPTLNDAAAFEAKDQIRAFHMPQIMSDQKRGVSLVQTIERLEHDLFILFVEAGRGLIEN